MCGRDSRLGETGNRSVVSHTGVGGYVEASEESTPQFDIADNRSVADVVASIARHGFQPVYKDWDCI